MTPAITQAFATIDQLTHTTVWDLSGECIVVRETWLDGAEVVRTVEHNYLEDNPPPAPESLGESVTIGAQDVGVLDVSKLGIA